MENNMSSKPKKNFNVKKVDMSMDSVKMLLSDLVSIIEETKKKAAIAVNTHQVTLFWHIGKRVNSEILNQGRALYGERVIELLSEQLTADYGKGFSTTNINRMVRFAQLWENQEILATLSQELSWSHIVELLPIKDKPKRDFYTEICRIERWSVRTLRAKIQSMLFERTAISRKPEALIEQDIKALKKGDQMSPDMVFRDPYILDFLDLHDVYSEKDFEAAILRELERFILELGSDFSFIARQKRMTIGNDDFYLDLLFFHRRLRRLIAIELKIGKFIPAHKGQMELYLRWLNKNERREGEEMPLGIILCLEKDHEQVELLELWKNGIHVAQYLTELPPKEVLEEKLHSAIKIAKLRVRGEGSDISGEAIS